jgi:hypothetical protein
MVLSWQYCGLLLLLLLLLLQSRVLMLPLRQHIVPNTHVLLQCCRIMLLPAGVRCCCCCCCCTDYTSATATAVATAAAAVAHTTRLLAAHT